MSDSSLKTQEVKAGSNASVEERLAKAEPPVRTGDPRINKKPEPVLDQEAFSIAKDAEGRFYLVTLKYDIVSGKAEISEKLEQPNRGEAFQRFKILVAQSAVMG